MNMKTPHDDSGQAQLILASASPRRRELLVQIGVPVRVQAVDIDESCRDGDGESVTGYVERLAMEKARHGFEVIDNPQGLPVLGSDTIVEIDGDILLKPASRQHARDMLQRLSGRVHAVHTAVAIVTDSRRLHALNSSRVRFASLDEDDIRRYVASGEADDKAGAYGIQGIAAQFIEHIEGSFSGVMGLPLYETRQLLVSIGIDPLLQYEE